MSSRNAGKKTMDDAEAVYRRTADQAQGKPPSAETVDRWLSTLMAGRFSDISYPPQQAGANVAPLIEHLDRTKGIASFARSLPVDESAVYRAASLSALVSYTDADFRTGNWWYRQVGLARRAAQAALLLAEAPRDDDIASAVLYLSETTNTTMGWTGANQADFAYIQLCWAIGGWRNSGDTSLLEWVRASSEAASDLCMPVPRHGPENGDGISVDYSFSQHNVQKGTYSQLQAGSYGIVLASNLFTLYGLLSGAFAFRRESVRSLERFLIEGLGWFGYKGFYDFQVCGRATSRGMHGNQGLGVWAGQLLADDPEDADALEELMRRATGDESVNRRFIANRAYWVNDYMAHITPRFALWTKAVSTRTVGTESGNGENLKGYYMGTGTCFVVKTGEEYRDIQPIWDWQRIPGSTVEQVPAFDFPLVEWGSGAWGSHDFTGAVSYGLTGVSSMILTRRNVHEARKSVFALEDRALFVGSGIDTTAATHPVCTSVAQCRFADEFIVRYKGGGEERLGLGDRRTASDIAEVIHAGIRYLFPSEPQRVTVEAATRTGSWHDINRDKPENEVSGAVFSIWIDHPQDVPGAYLYEVSAVEDTIDAAWSRLAVTADEHVYFDQEQQCAMGAVFAGESRDIAFDIATVNVVGPALFMLRSIDASHLHLVVADPVQQLDEARLVVAWAGGARPNIYRIGLPRDDDSRGMSVMVRLYPTAGVRGRHLFCQGWGTVARYLGRRKAMTFRSTP